MSNALAVGKDRSNISKFKKTAEVVKSIGDIPQILSKTYHLSAIHQLPEVISQLIGFVNRSLDRTVLDMGLVFFIVYSFKLLCSNLIKIFS